MKTLSMLMACAAIALAPAAVQAASPAAGVWSGAIDTPYGDLPVVVRVSDDGLKGDFDSPSQPQANGIPLTVTEASAKRLAFEIPMLKASYAGVWDEGRQAWLGDWSQSGLELPLALRKGAPVAAANPPRP